MKLAKYLAVLYLTAACLSCHPNSSDLDVTISPQQATFIDTATESCMDVVSNATSTTGTFSQSVLSLSVRFANIKLKWNGVTNFVLSYISLTSSDPALANPYSCTISGQELDYLFNFANPDVTTPEGGEITGPSTATGAVACSMACGGVTMANPKFTRTIVMRIDVVGYGTDGVNETPVDTVVMVPITYTSHN
jgi:hypothetical protein